MGDSVRLTNYDDPTTRKLVLYWTTFIPYARSHDDKYTNFPKLNDSFLICLCSAGVHLFGTMARCLRLVDLIKADAGGNFSMGLDVYNKRGRSSQYLHLEGYLFRIGQYFQPGAAFFYFRFLSKLFGERQSRRRDNNG